MFKDIKITINGTEIDMDDVLEMNDGEPLDVIDILDAVKYELENVAGKTFEDVQILTTPKQ